MTRPTLLRIIFLIGLFFLTLTSGCTGSHYETAASISCVDCGKATVNTGHQFEIAASWSGTVYRTGPFEADQSGSGTSDPFDLRLSCGDVPCLVAVSSYSVTGVTQRLEPGEEFHFGEEGARDLSIAVRPLAGGTLSITVRMDNLRDGSVEEETFADTSVRPANIEARVVCGDGCDPENAAVGTEMAFWTTWKHENGPGFESGKPILEQPYRVHVDCGAVACGIETFDGDGNTGTAFDFDTVGAASFKVVSLEAGLLTLSVRLEHLDTSATGEIEPIEQMQFDIDRIELRCLDGELCGLEPIAEKFAGALVAVVGFAGEQPVFVQPEIFEHQVVGPEDARWNDAHCYELVAAIDSSGPAVWCATSKFVDDQAISVRLRAEHHGLTAALDLAVQP